MLLTRLTALALVAVVSFTACSEEPVRTVDPAPAATSDSPAGQEETSTPSASAEPEPGALPVAGSGLVRSGEKGDIVLRLAVHAVRRSDGATVLDWSVTPISAPGTQPGEQVGPVDLGEDQAFHGLAAYLIDTKARRVYRPLLDKVGQNANCLCTPYSLVESQLVLDETTLLQVAFPALPESMQTVDVQLPQIPGLSGVPVTPKGQVPTAQQEVDLAAAETLPEAARTKTFKYPARDPFNTPRQAMSITVNSVVSAPDQTALVWTITAQENGDGIGLGVGRPVNDNALASIMVAYKATIASGPGLVPSGAGADAKVLRARMAAVSTKKDRPTGFSAKHRWLECLCSDVQSFGGPTATRGQSVSLVTTTAALPPGTNAVDVIFPGGGVAPLRKVPVTPAPAVALGPPADADAGTWTFDLNNRLSGWKADEWPTPVPDQPSVARSKAVTDALIEPRTNQFTKTEERPKDVVVTLDSTVSFRPDSAVLTPRARQVIAAIGRDINQRARAGTTILVEGHVAGTDRGSVTVQQRLSDARARAVYGALRPVVGKQFGFEVAGRGATQPVAPNDSEANRRLNRRVEVTYQR